MSWQGRRKTFRDILGQFCFFIFSLRHCNFCYSAAKLQKNI
nr:MAG TPA: hypothetical protein [Caudoviricetes sp.]